MIKPFWLPTLSCITFAVGSFPAFAQWSPSASMDLGTGIMNMGLSQSILSGTRQIGSQRSSTGELSPKMQAYCRKYPSEGVCRRRARQIGTGTRPTTTSGHLQSLTFVPFPAISQQVESGIVDDLVKRNPKFNRDKIAATIARVKEQFDDMLRRYGASPTNLADVSTAYFVLGWESYASQTISPGKIQVVKNRITQIMPNTAIATLPDDQKQVLAEKMSYAAMFNVFKAQNAHKVNDPKATAAAKQQIRQQVLETIGIDLQTVNLNTL